MKLKVIFALILAVSMFSVGCGTKTESVNGEKESQNQSETVSESESEKENLKTLAEVLGSMKDGDEKCEVYDIDKYLAPIWESQIIYNETVMFIKDENGNLSDKELTYPIAKVLEVRSADLKTVYEEGKDYEITQDGKLRALSGTAMPITEFEDNYTDEDNGVGVTSKKYPDKYLAYGEGVYFYYRQVLVTYVRTEKYNGPEVNTPTVLTKTIEKLSTNQPLSVVFYGASITEGCNSSGFANKEPYMPTWPTMVVEKLADYYGNKNITYRNTAVGGWTTEQGWEHYNERVLSYNPDLLFLDFGGNDLTWSFTTERFGMKLCQMIEAVKKKNPNVEIVLLTPLMPNEDAVSDMTGEYRKNQEEYLQTIIDISTGYEGVTVANLTDMHKWLLERKDYEDMTGNNINHPSDYLIRVLTQVILSSFI